MIQVLETHGQGIKEALSRSVRDQLIVDVEVENSAFRLVAFGEETALRSASISAAEAGERMRRLREWLTVDCFLQAHYRARKRARMYFLLLYILLPPPTERGISLKERGLNVWRDVAPRQWDFVNVWKLRQGKTIKTVLGPTTIQRAMALQQGYYRQAEPKLKEFERAFQTGEANLRVVFQLQEGPEAGEKAERWPEKLRRMARYLGLKPNELANRMIAAGILALEREDVDYEPDFVAEYRQKVILPKIEQYQSEKKLAEAFNPYSDVPKELESDGWAFMGLIEVTNLHNRELIDGLLEGKSVEETFSEISRDSTLSHAYLDKLKSIYTSPALSLLDRSSPTA